MNNYIITISRSYGSGGKAIGKRVAELLGIGFYDRDLLSTQDERERESDERLSFSLAKTTLAEEDAPVFISNDETFLKQSERIRQLGETQSCVIVGRCADYILRNHPNLIKLFLYASDRSCLRRVMKLYSLNPDEARDVIRTANRERSTYYKHYTGREWHDTTNYDLCVDAGILGVEQCAEILRYYIKKRLEGEF